MLLTVTSNPAIDRTLHVPHLEVGHVHRTAEVYLTAGGKGLNVARAARSLQQSTLATGPLAGHVGRLVAELAEREGLPAEWYWLEAGETRNSLLLTHDTGDATVVNENGPVLSREIWRSFTEHVQRLALRAHAVAVSSSLPPGVPPSAHGALARSLAVDGRPVYLDTSGLALAEALSQPRGLCIKVNRQELGEGLAAELQSEAELLDACRHVLGAGAWLVVVSLGSEGAMAVSPTGAWRASAPRVRVSSTVGSGDSLLAGLAVERMRGRRLDEALAFGIACGSANAMSRHPARFEWSTALELMRHVKLRKLG
jgi:1-phosphofructokinase family hexose kinase